jgi:pilus assembly protein Flp/PilA
MLDYLRKLTSGRSEDGASAVEYGLLVAGIAALIVAIVFIFGGVIKNAFQGTCDRVKQGSGTTAVSCT